MKLVFTAEKLSAVATNEKDELIGSYEITGVRFTTDAPKLIATVVAALEKADASDAADSD